MRTSNDASHALGIRTTRSSRSTLRMLVSCSDSHIWEVEGHLRIGESVAIAPQGAANPRLKPRIIDHDEALCE